MNYMLSIERLEDGGYMVYVMAHGLAIPLTDVKWRTQAAAVYEATRCIDAGLQ